MTQANFKHRLNRGLVWVAGASSFVAVLDIIALILILKYWIGLKDFGVATTVLAFHGTFELLAEIGLTSAVIQKTRQKIISQPSTGLTLPLGCQCLC